MRVLVVNAGSSSVKLRLLDGADRVVGACDLEAPAGRARPGEVEAAIEELGPADAVGHRIVHGGPDVAGPARVTDELVARLRSLTPLAPLHQPAGVAGIETVTRLRPGLPAVACFDTAFHAGIPAAAATYALPAAWRHRWPLRRFGFHGLSHDWVARRVADLAGPDRRLVSCHLGSGASLAAVAGGRSVDTTMGFTPLAGLVMGTRSGDVDPGLVLWLLRQGGLDVEEVADGLHHRAGLAGLAGEADVRAVVARAEAGDPDARLALDVAGHQLRRLLAAMASALGGIDVVAFTGGVGEHQPRVRAAAASGMAFLGLHVDDEANATAHGEATISPPDAPVLVLVVPAREDLTIAGQVRTVLRAA